MSYLQVNLWSETLGLDTVAPASDVVPRIGEQVFWGGINHDVKNVMYEYQGNPPNVCTIAVVQIEPVVD